MELNQVVWGKVRGFPWWPGIVINKQITEIAEKGFKVEFIGDKC